MTVLVCLSLCLFLAGGGQYSYAADVPGNVTLTLPRTPAHNEAVRVVVSVGILPPDAMIVVRTMDGEIAGSVSPFGVRRGQPAGVYMIPLPETAIKQGKVSLILELEQKDGGVVRAPTAQELLGVELVYIPITR
ncbi:MAG: hypothetical protein ACIWVG_00970 [Gloeotrichia echinulata HAB0833]